MSTKPSLKKLVKEEFELVLESHDGNIYKVPTQGPTLKELKKKYKEETDPVEKERLRRVTIAYTNLWTANFNWALAARIEKMTEELRMKTQKPKKPKKFEEKFEEFPEEESEEFEETPLLNRQKKSKKIKHD